MMIRNTIALSDLQCRPMRDTQPETEAEADVRVRRKRAELLPAIKAEHDRLRAEEDRLDRLAKRTTGKRRKVIRGRWALVRAEANTLQTAIEGPEPPEPSRVKLPQNVIRQGRGFIVRAHYEWRGRRVYAKDGPFPTVAEAEKARDGVRLRIERKIAELEQESERGERTA